MIHKNAVSTCALISTPILGQLPLKRFKYYIVSLSFSVICIYEFCFERKEKQVFKLYQYVHVYVAQLQFLNDAGTIIEREMWLCYLKMNIW